MPRHQLIGLQAHLYEHPHDRNALSSLKGTAGLETVIRKFNEYSIERFFRIQYTGSNLRINGDNYPELHGLVSEAAAILGLRRVPDVYVMGEEGGINAFTAGVERPIIVLTASCIDHLSEDELTFVIGHELGHIKSEHVLYRQIGAMVPMVGGVVGAMTLGVSKLISTALEVTLLNWQRMSELTADRAGLLVCQSANASISALAKIAGLPHKLFDRFNVDDFIAQAKEFKDFDASALDKVAKFFTIMDHSHPWTVLRAAELLAWIESGEYERIFNACERQAIEVGSPGRFCPRCKHPLLGDESYCPGCGVGLVEADSSPD